ncbi:alpha/beta hydrolase [Actinomadura rupiterrae]|uniref:alpha/beta hydrolase n=1 Tax=Actinomadura rupiterrae TaxID=559627 RepID=UPI0020A4DAFF|nr:alpha/beta hydrolase family protein [Actinomadura rupiterrae]MCP2343099.1 S-formylglutathione hydrolase FrmB [Actinomadura rupiterrae]
MPDRPLPNVPDPGGPPPAASARSAGPRRALAVGAAAAACAVALGLAAPAASARPMDGAQTRPSAAAVSVKAADGAQITATTWLSDREVDLTVNSPALGKSVKVRVLVPQGWSADASRTWPVLYALHGGNDDYTSWTTNSDIATWAAGYDVMVVMPEAANGSYTDWYNYGMGGNPRWETFHTQEVRQLLEANLRAGDARAVIGNSSGGQGAFDYAARHPGLFKYAASLSGILSMRYPGIPAMLMMTNAASGQDPNAIWGIPLLNDANWAAHDPKALADKLRGVGLFFSSGTTGKPGPGDPQVAPWDIGLLSEIAVGAENKDFQQQLDRLGIPYTAHIYGDGRHNWPAWRREAQFIWPTLMQSIGASAVQS